MAVHVRQARFRRFDLKLYPRELFPFALLHFTSGREFNIAMRAHAGRCGLRLSEKGFSHKGTETRVRTPHIASEADIFAALGLAWQEPGQRVAQVHPTGPPQLELLGSG